MECTGIEPATHIIPTCGLMCKCHQGNPKAPEGASFIKLFPR